MDSWYQSYIHTYIIVCTICLLFSVLVLSQLTSDVGTKMENNTFKKVIYFYIIFICTNFIWLYANHNGDITLGYSSTTLNLISICLCTFFWYLHIRARLKKGKIGNKGTAFLIIYTTSLITLIITTPISKYIVYYDENDKWMHGNLYFIIDVYAFTFLAISAIDLIKALKTEKRTQQRINYIDFLMFIVLPLIGGIIDMIWSGIPIMEMVLIFGITFIFISLQSSQINQDALTKLNNRRRTDEFLKDSLENAIKDNKPLYMYIGDINNFKKINDTYGHQEGDEALNIVAKVLRRIAQKNGCFVSRWGGDEFVIIFNREVKNPEEITKKINEQLTEETKTKEKEYELQMTFGYATRQEKTKYMNEMFETADSMLYYNKKLEKQK